MISQSVQDYLKTIYLISNEEGNATTNALAEQLGVSAASVTGMLQRMSSASPALVTYRKHQGVTLTLEGQHAALKVIRHHRLLETYLVKNLGFSWDEVHVQAEVLEHAISDDLEARIDASLGHPSRDPHGDLIPTPDLTMPSDDSLPLSDLRPPQNATIRRVQASDPLLLSHLESLGLIPGTTLEILAYSTFDEILTLRVEGQENPIIIGPGISMHLFVETRVASQGV
jgi:DtxR family Mn-dependent transcriptional regulator